MRRLRDALDAGCGAADGVGQALSGRAAAALGALRALAEGRRAGLARPGAAGDGGRHRRRHCGRRRSGSAPAWPNGCRSIPSLIIPAYEDIHYYLWREHRLPANVLAEDAKLKRPAGARAAGARVRPRPRRAGRLACCRCAARSATTCASGRAASGSSAATRCSCSPAIHRSATGCRWIACPGPIAETIEHETEPDPFAPRAPLPPRQAFVPSRRPCMGAGRRGVPPGAAGTSGGRPRRARPCAHRAMRRTARRHASTSSSRRCTRREDWLALVAAVEDTAGGTRPQGGAGRLSAAARSAACCISRSRLTQA